MRALLRQTKNGLTSTFKVDGICGVTVHRLSAKFDNGYTLVRSFNPHVCDLRNPAGESIGSVRKRVRMFRSVQFVVDVNGVEASATSIGMWKQGVYWPVYVHGTQVAMIHKNNVVHDNLDEYELYAISAQAMKVAILLAVFIDMHEYKNFAQYCSNKVEYKLSWTLSKKVRESLDLGFIDRC